MRKGSLVLLSSLIAVALIGCGDSTPPAKEPSTTVSATPPPPPPPASAQVKHEEPKEEPKKEEPPPPPPPPKKTAKDVITPGSTFMFVLDQSPEQMKARLDPCAKKKKDEDKKKCEQEAHDAAAKEGIKFDKAEKGEGWTFVWFSTDAKGKEVDLEKVNVANPKEEGDTKLTVEAADKDSGKKAMKVKKGDKITFEVPDETTVVVNHPKEGKLVFKKKLPAPCSGFVWSDPVRQTLQGAAEQGE